MRTRLNSNLAAPALRRKTRCPAPARVSGRPTRAGAASPAINLPTFKRRLRRKGSSSSSSSTDPDESSSSSSSSSRDGSRSPSPTRESISRVPALHPALSDHGTQPADDATAAAMALAPVADACGITWTKIKGHPFWPTHRVALDAKLRRDMRFVAAAKQRYRGDDTCVMYFGTCEVAFVNAEKTCISWGEGVRRELHRAVFKVAPFDVALREVAAFCETRGRQTPPNWWCEPSTEREPASTRPAAEQPRLPRYEHVEVSRLARGVYQDDDPYAAACCECGMTGCADEDCLNVASRFICPTNCPGEQHCRNQAFHLRRSPAMTPFLTSDGRGWGCRVDERVRAGTFITEYVGEIIDHDMLHDRMQAAEKLHEPGYYVMELGDGLLVDARHKGNLSRFINSSCEPNCETQKWTCAEKGSTHVGIFATENIPAGTELTYDYCFEDFGLLGKSATRSFVCRCGTGSCVMLEPHEREHVKRLVGGMVEVRWDDGWYAGSVERFDAGKKRFRVKYSDGDFEELMLGLRQEGEEDDGVKYRIPEA